MNISVFIAKRYLFSKKSVNAINVISGISMVGVMVASAALIIILSVFNGLENLVLSMYSSFAPELRIEPAEGKVFFVDTALADKIKQDKRISHYSDVLQEKVLLKYEDYQCIATIKGVDSIYGQSRDMDSLLWDGSFFLKSEGLSYAILGAGVYSSLGLSLTNNTEAGIEVFSPRKGAKNSINPADEFNQRMIPAAGIFKAQQELDNLMLVPIDFARDVVGEHEGVSAIEIDLKPAINIDRMQREFEETLGPKFRVKNRAQQHPELYKLLNSEKWMVFFILAFVLVIAAFNIVGSLTMLVIDKQKDVAVLSSLGASKKLIKRIFFLEGMFISMIGCMVGLSIGIIFCAMQQKFGFVHMGEGSIITDAYPVAMRATDFLLVFFTVLIVSGVASFISAQLSVKKIEQLKASE